MSKEATFGSLFSGIGGMDLGLERAGMRCAWQVEIDEYARRVLTKHWPDVPKFTDVRTVGKHNLTAVDVIAGGFPCQDISPIGTRRGLQGERSGLWGEYFRIICEIRPSIVLVENSSDLLIRGFDTVLRDLASRGYNAEWQVLSACAFGFPHPRKRLFILAYTDGIRHPASNNKEVLSSAGDEQQWEKNNQLRASISQSLQRISDSEGIRGDYGLSVGMDGIKGLGNAVVPQVAEWIGRQILRAI